MAYVLVTGHSGTIGSAVCKKLLESGHDVVGFSRSPSTINPDIPYVMGDISDKYRLASVFSRYPIQKVIHLAANKFLDLCEESPAQAIQSNIIGVMNLLELLDHFKVEKAVLISTDKVINRDHVYGMTKCLGEKLVASAQKSYTTINSVRFGNVLGSNGSVLFKWLRNIKQGLPIELRTNDPDSFPTRFFISPKEAAAFCINVLEESNLVHGSILTKQMKSTDIKTLAEVLAPKHPVVYRSLQPKESRNEKILSSEDMGVCRFIDNVDHGKYIEIHPSLANNTISKEEMLRDWVDSDSAPRYSDDEIRSLIKESTDGLF